MKPYHRSLFNVMLLLSLLLVGNLLTVDVSRAQSAPLSDTVLIDQIILDPVTGRPTQVILFDGGMGNLPLQNLVVVFLSNRDHTVLAAYPIADIVTDQDGFFTLDLTATAADRGVEASALQSADALALATGGVDGFTAGTVLDTSTLLDMVIYAITDNNELLAMRPLPAEAALPAAMVASAAAPAVAAAAAVGTCGADATAIHAVQGATAASPLLGQTVTVEGLVVGDFQNVKTQLRGFFVQEEASDQDADPTTSEGLFVFDNGLKDDVQAGDRVRVRGLVQEFNTMTELKRLEKVVICDQNNPLEPALVTLPEAVDGDLEQVEGMLIHLANEMTVAQTYFLGRYGQMTLAAAGRLYQPTNLFPPDSPEAQALAAENARRLLVLDDGRDLSALGDNPNPVPYLGAPPPTVIRAGDTVTNLVGVLDYGRINSAPGAEVALDYRLQPTQAPVFITGNARTDTPAAVGGALKVASFNVLNYFNGDGQGSGFPTARGAQSAAEFQRQRAKIIAALHALDADVVGLMEIENDGYGATSAIQDLVNGLNETEPTGISYAFIDPGLPRLGGDEIAVGLLYKTNTITPTGPAVTLDTGAFDQTLADGGRSRQPLVQTFVDHQGERFTVAVNHFKSKRPGDNITGGDADNGNGAGAWNARRTQAAQDLVAWLATDPTGSGDPDFLIIGDLNSYAQEAPITTIEGSGYVNLIHHYAGDEAYSYIFDGQVGYLDHALASSALVTQTTGAVEWHINTDEPKVIDYEARFNPAGYYSPDPFRASDHDPVLIGLALGQPVITDTNPITETEPITDTGPITTTPPITDTEGITDTETVTSTEPLTGTETVTDTEPITETGGITDTEALTGTDGLTTTVPITTTPPLTQTEGGTDTPSVDQLPIEYEAQPGDNLSLLARRFSVTIAALARANGLTSNRPILLRQRLLIPPVERAVPCWRSIVGQPGENLATLAARYNAEAERLAQFNGLSVTASIEGVTICIPNIYTGYVAPPSPYFSYQVRPGDTLLAIAHRYQVAVLLLQRLNHLPNPDYLDVGQRLQIPR